ncbi:DUF4889 domain-containing protein [Staphylococcus lutrae]|uniref:DUF4889 domain-containing protein n=1 Tax=Staphylococcus lutrae TaxID=155085 RepID=A0AAC9RRS6_9STAP|nr:DUF4889 domain-containing protein [Staphylococcus lutrae]ARJ50531.1 DUF4889 domain-containing protein [Staphylococcus lutrae]PNZ37433.1 DUF4889 domain-containing protein [Staphylococcus lutrae]
MKEKQTIGIVLIVAMLFLTVGVIAAMMLSGQKEIYYGYMKSDTVAEKVVRESDKTVTENVTIPTDAHFKPQKGDFVKLVTKKHHPNQFIKKEIVSHDSIPHGLMMKIHEMHQHMH